MNETTELLPVQDVCCQLIFTPTQVSKEFLNWSSTIIYNKTTRCNSGSFVFIKNYKYALHVSDALCVHHQEHYKL